MDERTERDKDLDGAADLVREAAADARANARWVRHRLREALTAFGVRNDPGSDPDDP